MPNVSTVISYEAEGDLGKYEVSSYRRDVADLDLYDWAWYLMKITEVMGFDINQIQLITKDGKIYSTDL